MAGQLLDQPLCCRVKKHGVWRQKAHAIGLVGLGYQCRCDRRGGECIQAYQAQTDAGAIGLGEFNIPFDDGARPGDIRMQRDPRVQRFIKTFALRPEGEVWLSIDLVQGGGELTECRMVDLLDRKRLGHTERPGAWRMAGHAVSRNKAHKLAVRRDGSVGEAGKALADNIGQKFLWCEPVVRSGARAIAPACRAQSTAWFDRPGPQPLGRASRARKPRHDHALGETAVR